jgi:hypothetical protein
MGSPIEISILFSNINNKHFFEIGTGLTFLNEKHLDNNHTDDLIILVLRAGYRFQKPTGGFFLKTGLTPMYDWIVINPEPNIDYHSWILLFGIGVGYTF